MSKLEHVFEQATTMDEVYAVAWGALSTSVVGYLNGRLSKNELRGIQFVCATMVRMNLIKFSPSPAGAPGGASAVEEGP